MLHQTSTRARLYQRNETLMTINSLNIMRLDSLTPTGGSCKRGLNWASIGLEHGFNSLPNGYKKQPMPSALIVGYGMFNRACVFHHQPTYQVVTPLYLQLSILVQWIMRNTFLLTLWFLIHSDHAWKCCQIYAWQILRVQSISKRWCNCVIINVINGAIYTTVTQIYLTGCGGLCLCVCVCGMGSLL